MASSARDNFEQYFAEKLWEMIPAVYRHEDGIAENPGVLRAMVEVLAEQAAILRRSHDRLWEDQFIELCQSWAVPYLADLLGTRLVSALNTRGRRVDVAKTIYYRRRKGTLRVLEELIGDITGWEGAVVEMFRRLARARHGLDPQVDSAGTGSASLTSTPPGGWADLRRPHGAELAGGPFDEYFHTPDVRRHRGVDGRYAIPKLAFHLFRLQAFQVEGVTPLARPDGLSFSFDPSGRDIPLFMPPSRADDWDDWHPAEEWELPGPIRCRLLGHAAYQIDEALVDHLVDDLGLIQAAADELRPFIGARFPDESHLRAVLASLGNGAALLASAIYQAILAGALVSDCAKRALLPAAVWVEDAPGALVPPELTVSAGLPAWSAIAPGKRLAVDPERGRCLFIGGPPAASAAVGYYYGFSAEIGAGTYDRREVAERTPDFHHQGGGAIPAAQIANNGVTQIDDSATYGPVSDKLNVKKLTFQVKNQQRPYLRLESHWVLNSGANQEAEILLDGLWLGGTGAFDVLLRGDYEQVVIRSCTFDPGGVDRDGSPIHPLRLVVEAQVETLRIESSIMGPITVQGNGVIEVLEVKDSILQSIQAGVVALNLPNGEARLERVTVFGHSASALTVDVLRLYATETLITGLVDVTDTQNGCFRFSAAPSGSRLPKAYESHEIDDSEYYFTSRRFGHPGYAQLSAAAPCALLRGAENGSEIGAFSSLINPVRMDGLRAKVDEYLPFGLIPIYIAET